MREGDFTDPEYREIIVKLDEDWLRFDRLEVSNAVSRHAGQLAEPFALRGYDAIHPASALHLAERFEKLRFLAFDHRLVDAARVAGVPVYMD